MREIRRSLITIDRPRDSLTGIYVEASDEALEQAGGGDTGSAGESRPQPAALFGLTLTADAAPTLRNPMHGRQVADQRFQPEGRKKGGGGHSSF